MSSSISKTNFYRLKMLMSLLMSFKTISIVLHPACALFKLVSRNDVIPWYYIVCHYLKANQ